MALILDGTTGCPVTTVTGTLPVANGGTGVTTSTGTGAVVLGTSPSISGAVMTTMASSVLTSASAQNSTSGTSIDFTSIPSWVKRITVMFNGVSANGTSNLLVQLGTGGTPTYTTSGYISTSNGGTVGSSTAGFIVWEDTPSQIFSGSMTIFNISGNVWVQSHVGKISTTSCVHGGGDVSLGAALTAVRITRVNGTDTFDAGSINIMYE